MTILEGSTFCICDEIGDLDGRTSGFFAEDTRFLSRLELRVNGARPLLLSSGKVEYFSAAFYLRNPVVAGLPQDSLSIARERFVGDGMQDHLVLRNEAASRCASSSRSRSAPTSRTSSRSRSTTSRSATRCTRARSPPPPPSATTTAPTSSCSRSTARRREDAGAALAGRARSRARASASSSSSRRGSAGTLRVDVVPSLTGEESLPLVVERRFGEGRAHVQASLDAWHLQVPRLRTSHDDLARSFAQSVADLAALRMRTDDGIGKLPAAGMPWFMTVFGRDTLITSLQTMLLGPELAIASLDALAALRRARTTRRSTPSRARSSTSCAAAGPPRRGSAPTTAPSTRRRSSWSCSRRSGAGPPTRRSSSGCASPRSPRCAGSTSTATATATASSSTSGGRRAGSRTSRGRTPATRSASTTARSRGPRSRRPRCRATSTTRRCGWPSSRAPSGGDEALAARLEAEAAELRRRFDEQFWVEERGGFYALALDARQAAGRLALLEHRPPALERDRPAGAPARGRRETG